MSNESPAVYLGLGSNLGDRAANLREALRRLSPLARPEEVSSLYETAPVGEEEQPPFYNAVCRIVTALEPEALLRSPQGDRVRDRPPSRAALGAATHRPRHPPLRRPGVGARRPRHPPSLAGGAGLRPRAPGGACPRPGAPRAGEAHERIAVGPRRCCPGGGEEDRAAGLGERVTPTALGKEKGIVSFSGVG